MNTDIRKQIFGNVHCLNYILQINKTEGIDNNNTSIKYTV